MYARTAAVAQYGLGPGAGPGGGATVPDARSQVALNGATSAPGPGRPTSALTASAAVAGTQKVATAVSALSFG